MEEQDRLVTEIWARYMDYLYNTAMNMRKIYRQKVNNGQQITDAELDDINKRVHHSLDVIVANNSNVTDSTAPKYESRSRKQIIKLTESDLHRVIKESVKRVLKEAAYNGNHVGRDNGNGRFEMTHPEGKYSLYFDKAQRDAHNYNAQQQGQIPNPYAGWSKRVNDGNGNWSDAEFNGEEMHMYKDDNATTTAQNLRQYDPNGAYHWDMFRGHGDQYRQS